MSSSDFRERFEACRVEVEAHAKAEEKEVLPLLDERWASHELHVMGTRFVIVEMIAPTHAHRGPKMLTGNLLVG